MESLERNLETRNQKDGNDEAEILADERILAPGLTIVEDEATLTSADLSTVVPSDNAVMYRVMQVGSSGEMIELPQIVTGNFTSSSAQPALLNPINTGQFYIVGASDVIGASQRTIAPRGNVQTRDPITTRGASLNIEPKDDRRRVSHNEVERRRRDKINNWILKLGKIMPDSVHGDTGKGGQQSKGGILSKACDYITDIRTANQRLAEALRQSENHVEELQAENAALRKEIERLHLASNKN